MGKFLTKVNLFDACRKPSPLTNIPPPKVPDDVCEEWEDFQKEFPECASITLEQFTIIANGVMGYISLKELQEDPISLLLASLALEKML